MVGASRASILLVDDSDAELERLERVLAPLAHPFLRARSGEDALALLLAHDVACVLLDVQMGGLDGFDVARLLDSQAHEHVPLVLLTDLARDEAHVLRAYSRGRADYVLKPYDADTLRALSLIHI